MTPDAFLHDWYGWITNQAGHALIVGAMPFALLSPILGRLRAFVALALVYAGWEVWQVVVQGGSPGDGLADWGFVMAGAALVWAAWERKRVWAFLIWLALAIGFFFGVWRRWK